MRSGPSLPDAGIVGGHAGWVEGDGVTIDEVGVRFEGYPFAPASVFPDGLVAWADVREVGTGAAPPEVRTLVGEVLFVPADRAGELERFAGGAGVPDVSRIDVWGLILDPFLDTAFDDAEAERTLDLLEANHVPRPLVASLRAELGEVMYAYNITSGLWDWVSLGLFDVLRALQGDLAGERFRLPPAPFAAFYRHAMEIAVRAEPAPPRPSDRP